MKGLIVFLALPCLISCWKPISPSFTLSQTFPEFGAGSESIKATNEVLGDGSSSVDRFLTAYNGNDFIDHEHVSDSAEYGVGFNQGRIFNGKSLNFGQKFLHNGLYNHEVSIYLKFRSIKIQKPICIFISTKGSFSSSCVVLYKFMLWYGKNIYNSSWKTGNFLI